MGLGISSSAYGFYPRNNPSGFITGVDLSSYATAANLNNTGSTLNIKIDSVSGYLQNQINNISGGGGGGGSGVTGDYYPNSNPSGFITGIDTSNFYTKDNPSGFITGVDLSSYATIANLNLTGSTLNTKINNLSGASVLTFGDQIINGTKYFTNDVYIHDLYVTGTEFIANVENNFIESPYILLNLTGGAIDGGIFFVTGAGLTGVNDYGPIIGFDHSNKFKFGIARRSDDLSILNDIAAVQDITNYSGFVDNKYYTKDNQSGFITGIDLSNYYTNNNPSGYITNQNVVFTTGNQNIDGTKIFSNKLIANSGVDIYFSQTAGTGVFVSGLWNNTGQTHVGIRYDVRLASGVVPSTTNSLANIRVNNTGVFNINSRGEVLIRATSPINYTNLLDVRNVNNSSLFMVRDDGTFEFSNQGGAFYGVQINAAIRNGAFNVAQQSASTQGYFGWSRTNDAFNNTADITTRLYRGGDFILDLRNPEFTNSGHQFRVFNISATNTGEFGLFGWQRTGTTGTPNALVIGAQATQSGILREVILSGRNLRIPTGDLFIGTTGAGTSRILLANPAGTNFYHITPAQYNLSIGHLGGNALTIDSNYISSNTNFTLNGAGYLFGEGTNRFIGLRDTYGGNNTLGGNDQGLNIYKVYSGVGIGFPNREFLTLGWTGFTGIIGTTIGQSGTLRDLIITGANINIRTSGTTNFNNRPTVNGTGVLLSGEGGSVDLSAYATKIDLASTGTTLNTKIDSFSGFANDNFYLKSNPSGFITGVDLSNYVTKTNAEFTNRPTVNGTGVLLSGEGGTVTLPNTIVYTTGNQTISGTKTFDTRPQVNGTGVLLSGEGGVSTSSSKIIDKFTASSNQPPPSGFATLDTRSSVLVLDYDDTVTQSGTFIGMIPETAGTITGLQVRILWTATTATGNNCRWGARFADLSSSGIDAPFDSETEVNSAANSVSGKTSTADIFCSGTAGLAANEFYRLLIYRNSADTVNDTMAGDAELVSVTTYLT